jgi:hypothetical protein
MDGALNVLTSAPVATSIAARRDRAVPSTFVKAPPAYTVRPSGETASAYTAPFRTGSHPGSGAPVVASNAARLLRGSVPAPAPPSSSACVNEPPMITTSPTWTIALTRPFVPHVRSGISLGMAKARGADASVATSATQMVRRRRARLDRDDVPDTPC